MKDRKATCALYNCNAPAVEGEQYCKKPQALYDSIVKKLSHDIKQEYEAKMAEVKDRAENMLFTLNEAYIERRYE